jgi:hypothetical protein
MPASRSTWWPPASCGPPCPPGCSRTLG